MASADGNTLAQQKQLRQEHHYRHPPSSDRYPRHLRASTAAVEAVTDMVPFLPQLSGDIDSKGDYLPNAAAPVISAGVKVKVGTTAAATGAGVVVGVGGAAATNTGVVPDNDNSTADAARPGPEERERDLDAERQALLTMLLAHACFEHDATPRTFVEQVLRLYETKVLDSIQFLFDMGFVPRVAEAAAAASVRTDAVNRAAIAEAVRRRIDEASASDPLLLSAWPAGATVAAAGAAAWRDGGAANGGSAVNDDSRATSAALGLRVLSTSRYWRDFEEEKLIARGSFGDVYRTRHRLDGKRYAIKKVVFRGTGVSHPNARAVMREVQCLAQLDHKNIVRYHTSWLESGWMEKGVRHYRQHAAPESRDATSLAGDGRGNEPWPLAAATRPRALTNGSNGTMFTDERHPADVAAYVKDALVCVRPHFTPGGAEEPWSGGVESESNLGMSFAFGNRVDTGSVDCYDEGAKASRRGRPRGNDNGPWGGGLEYGNEGAGGDISRASVAPPRKNLSPKGVVLQPEARERGFTQWTAEDVESDTSRWSEMSSGAGIEWEINEAANLGGPAGGRGASSRFSNRSRKPPGIRKLRAEMFRHPSIDIDDLVSFGTSSPTGGGPTTDHGDEMSGGGGWSDWEGANPNDALRRGVGGCHRSGGGHDRRGSSGESGNWTRPSASSDKLVQYPVTLYIQMNLCPGDTLQDWLVKRNARLTSETETSGNGILSRDHERLACSGSDSSFSAPTICATSPASHPVPMLSSPPLLAEDLDAGIKPRGTPAISPRTDPVTYASSDETSESSSNCSGGDELVMGVAQLCQEPPPLPREVIAGLLSLGGDGARQGFDTVSYAAACGGTRSPKPVFSPACSLVSDGAVVCKGSGQPGRVDLHEALRMFRQLAEGVAHIHSKGIMHRDIKPDNVFVGEHDCLKIGDFGLSRTEAATTDSVVADTEPPSAAASSADKAFPRSSPSASDAPNPQYDPVVEEDEEKAAIVPRPPSHGKCHTGGVGTASYASPEQLQGQKYGVRSDLFSLGLVLLELCCCFATSHERADVFQSMRRPDGTAPERLKVRSPFLAELAELLCRTDPELRPTAAAVLERLDALGGRCGCPGCPGRGRSDGGCGRTVASGVLHGGRDTDEPGDVRLREELAEKTQKVVEQEALIDKLQRKLTELSRNSSPRIEPAQPSRSGDASALNMEALGLGLAAAAGVMDCAETLRPTSGT